MKIIYVAGPFRANLPWEIEKNVRRAEDAAALLVQEFGLMPMIPHANTRYFHGMGSDSFWLDGTLELMRRCDALYLIDGWENSSGSRGEKVEAERLKMPIFTSDSHLQIRHWLNGEGKKPLTCAHGRPGGHLCPHCLGVATSDDAFPLAVKGWCAEPLKQLTNLADYMNAADAVDENSNETPVVEQAIEWIDDLRAIVRSMERDPK